MAGLPLYVSSQSEKPGQRKVVPTAAQNECRKLRPQNTRTNYEQAKFSRQSSNQFRNLTERIVADSKAKYEHTENFPDLKADKPAKAEETFDADFSKMNIVKL